MQIQKSLKDALARERHRIIRLLAPGLQATQAREV